MNNYKNLRWQIQFTSYLAKIDPASSTVHWYHERVKGKSFEYQINAIKLEQYLDN